MMDGQCGLEDVDLKLIHVDRVALFDSIIPFKAQKGLISVDLEFTSLDATQSFISIGSNVGIVFLYDRKSQIVHKLKYQGLSVPVTCVTARESTDLQLAVGYVNGTVVVYNAQEICNQTADFKRVLVTGFHRHAVSSLEWGSSGFSLYSGDKVGNVAETIVDYAEDVCKPSALITESHNIVQLNYLRDKLLVSTAKRSLVLPSAGKQTNLVQVGQQERKILGNFGAHFYFESETEETVIFASRPNLRLWKTSEDGAVKETLIFGKDSTDGCQEIPLMWRSHPENFTRFTQPQFGTVKIFGKFLVSCGQHDLFIINPRVPKMEAKCEHFENIRDLAVTQREVFVLDQKRSITRISTQADNCLSFSARMEEKKSFNLNSALKELEFKIKDASLTNLLDKWMPKNYKDGHCEQNTSYFEDQFVDLDCQFDRLQNITEDGFENPGQDNLTDIVYKPQKRSRVEDNESVVVITEENTVTSNSCLEESYVGQEARHNSLEAETKEKLLVEMFGLNDIRENLEPVLAVTTKPCLDVVSDNTDCNANEEFPNELDGVAPEKNLKLKDTVAYSLESYLSYGPPSGSSTALDSYVNGVSSDNGGSENSDVGNTVPRVAAQKEKKMGKRHFSYENEWIQYSTPGQIKGLAVCDKYVCCIDSTDRVYFSTFGSLGLEWHRTDVQAQQIAVSPSGAAVWRVYDNSAYALMKPSSVGPFGSHWIEVMLDVSYIAVDETCVWILKQNGEVCTQQGLGKEKICSRSIYVPYEKKVCQIDCLDGVVWALCSDGAVISREGVTRLKPEGSRWTDIGFDRGSALCVAVGRGGTGWVFDGSCYLWFKTGLGPDNPDFGSPTNQKWWQATISEFLFDYEGSGGSIFKPLMSFVDILPTEQLMALVTGVQTPSLSANSNHGLWLHQPYTSHLWTCRAKINGHHWRHLRSKNVLGQVWKIVSASGVFSKQGAVWLLEASGQLFALMPNSGSLRAVDVPPLLKPEHDKVMCIATAPETLWLLTTSGKILVRTGIVVDSSVGLSWDTLDLSQIGDRHLVHISCGSNSVWACDGKGHVLIRFGSLKASAHKLPPAWIVVEDGGESAILFAKVFVGSSDMMVWAIDSKQNVYAREGVFSDLPVGVGWISVPGIKAVTLSISETAVWALTSYGDVYCRYGITSNSYIGDFWKQIPATQFVDFGVTVDDNLWSVGKEGGLFHHSVLTLDVTGKAQSAQDDDNEWTECEPEASSNSLGDDWEWL